MRKREAISFVSSTEAETLKRVLDANDQSFAIAQHAMVENETKAPSVAAVIQEHIDLLVRPSVGTVHTYQTMLNLHVANVIGHIPVDKLDFRHLTYWIKAMQKKGKSPKTIRNDHGLILAAMETAIMLGYRTECRGVQLPSSEKAEDEARFLTHSEFGLILERGTARTVRKNRDIQHMLDIGCSTSNVNLLATTKPTWKDNYESSSEFSR